MNISAVLKNTVSISLFNRGLAGKIFNEVKKSGAKVVIKNNVPECVLLSPQEYLELMDEINDARLLMIANKRMQNYDPDANITFEEMKKTLDITDDDLDEIDEAEFE